MDNVNRLLGACARILEDARKYQPGGLLEANVIGAGVVAELDSVLGDARTEVADLRSRLDAARSEIVAGDSAVKALNAELANVKAQLEAARSQLEAVKVATG